MFLCTLQIENEELKKALKGAAAEAPLSDGKLVS